MLGKQLVMTAAVHDKSDEDSEFAHFVLVSLNRFANADWGDCQQDSIDMNNSAVKAWKEND